MKPKEMRELDQWIALNVMGWKRGEGARCNLVQPPPYKFGVTTIDKLPRYTTSPADALAVLEACLEKSGYGLILDAHDDAGFSIEHRSPMTPHSTGDETLALTICLFAKKLFEQ